MRLPNRPRILPFLNLVKLLLVLLMVVMFIQFNARIAQQQAATRTIAQNTNNVVKSQADILKAIKEVTDDTHVTAAQQTAIIICMLQVPVEERTTDLQAQCRAQANAPLANDNASQTGDSAPSTSSPGRSASSSQPAPKTSASQATPSQPSGDISQPKPNIIQKVINKVEDIL